MLRPPRPRRLEAGLSPVASGGALQIILLRSQRTPGPARAAGASGHAAAAGNLRSPLRQGRPQSGLRSVNAPRRSPSAKPRAASEGYSASIFALTSGFSVLPWQFRQTAAVGIAFR